MSYIRLMNSLNMNNHIEYKEDLEIGCPPWSAVDAEINSVYRLAPDDKVDESYFYSHKKKGISLKMGMNSCSYCSCSLTYNPEALIKVPNLRKKFKYAIELNLQKGSGRALKKGDHVDFWPYKSFKFNSSVIGGKTV